MVQDYVFPFFFSFTWLKLCKCCEITVFLSCNKNITVEHFWVLACLWTGMQNIAVLSFPKVINSIWFLVLNRISLISIMFLDWRMCGMKKPPSCRELTFFNFQMMSLHPHVHLACASSMEEGLERALEMRDHQTWRHPGEVHLMEDNGLIFFSLSISCKYYNNMDK